MKITIPAYNLEGPVPVIDDMLHITPDAHDFVRIWPDGSDCEAVYVRIDQLRTALRAAEEEQINRAARS
jgi:hypothetical protein